MMLRCWNQQQRLQNTALHSDILPCVAFSSLIEANTIRLKQKCTASLASPVTAHHVFLFFSLVPQATPTPAQKQIP